MATALATRDDNVTMMQRASTAYTLVEMRERVEQLDAFYRGLMQEGTDYGKIPGTDKPTLLQPGAQLACTYFGFAPTFELLPSSVENWEGGFFALSVRCRLTRSDGSAVAEGIGSCNSKEDKYRWRNQDPQCPACGMNTIRRGSAKFGGGFYCAAKSGGCGANFKNGPEADEIARQPTGRIENPEPWSLHNTILKMAEKRALVAATLNATGASRIFTQDIEDLPEFSRAPAPRVVDGEFKEEAPPQPQPASREMRQRFDKTRKEMCDRAIAIGVTPDDAPPADATVPDLRKATIDLKQAIEAREALNAALLERIALANEHGAGLVVPDPSKLPDEATHTQLETCARLRDAAEQADDSEAF